MNLYKILFKHAAPKDHKIGIETYLLASCEEEVYDYISKECTAGIWKDKEGDGHIFNVYGRSYNIIGTETFRERMIRIRGELNDEYIDFSDAYYGITLYEWELIKTDIHTDLKEFIELGIVERTNNHFIKLHKCSLCGSTISIDGISGSYNHHFRIICDGCYDRLCDLLEDK